MESHSIQDDGIGLADAADTAAPPAQDIISAEYTATLRSVLSEFLMHNGRMNDFGRASADTLAACLSDMDSEAADAARRGVTTLPMAHHFAAERLAMVREAIQRQVEALQTAASSVVPIPHLPGEPGVFDNGLAPAISSSAYDRALESYLGANARNVDVMAKYEAATRENQALLVAALANLNAPEPTPPGGELPAPPGLLAQGGITAPGPSTDSGGASSRAHPSSRPGRA